MSLSNPELPDHEPPRHLRIVPSRSRAAERDEVTPDKLEEELGLSTLPPDITITLADQVEAMRDRLEMYRERLAFLEEQQSLPKTNRLWAEKSESYQPSNVQIKTEILILKNKTIPTIEKQLSVLENEAQIGTAERPRAVNE